MNTRCTRGDENAMNANSRVLAAVRVRPPTSLEAQDPACFSGLLVRALHPFDLSARSLHCNHR